MNQLVNGNDRCGGSNLLDRGSALSYGLWRGRQSVQAGSAFDASDSLSRVSLEGIL